MSTPEAGLGDFMKLYIDEQRRGDERRDQERREENDRREEERQEEMSRREEERREEREQREKERAEARDREVRLWETMNRVATAPEPEPRHKPLVALPVMKESDEITEYLSTFESALYWRKVPREQWKELLVAHVPIELLMKVKNHVDDEQGTYDELVGALSNSSSLTFSAASEDLFTGERGRVWELEGRKAASRVKALVGQVIKHADNKLDIVDCILVRHHLVPGLKGYTDSTRRFDLEGFLGTCEEWERVQPSQTSWFRKSRTMSSNQGRN